MTGFMFSFTAPTHLKYFSINKIFIGCFKSIIFNYFFIAFQSFIYSVLNNSEYIFIINKLCNKIDINYLSIMNNHSNEKSYNKIMKVHFVVIKVIKPN